MESNPTDQVLDMPEKQAFGLLQTALDLMRNGSARTRELSVAITELETSMMWLNKDRSNKGQLPQTPTHV